MIKRTQVTATQETVICDRCKLDPNPAPVQSLRIKVGTRKGPDTGTIVRGDLCEDCLAILFKNVGITLPVIP